MRFDCTAYSAHLAGSTPIMRNQLVAAALVAAVSAQAAVLDFDYMTEAITTVASSGIGDLNPVGNGGWYSQPYGDVAGLVDVTYSYFAPGSSTAGSSLASCATGYDDLVQVAWSGSFQSVGDRAQVSLASVNGSQITLDNFDL
jgi:hypothetical protein